MLIDNVSLRVGESTQSSTNRHGALLRDAKLRCINENYNTSTCNKITKLACVLMTPPK